jgi:crotonobetainyl-CoA:carnitine CoA-transferase CaiB-like acyl-CoA transferase
MADNSLEGFRVLDFSRVLSGPYVTRILADFGAEVIKVQTKRTAKGVESNNSPYFYAWNRNKRSITLDMSHPEAKILILRLVKSCDIVVENYSPRVMANWGLDYDILKQVNSELIMLSMSAMGQSGPWKDFVAFAPTLQSLGGLTYLTSFSEHSCLGIGFSYADLISGLYGAILILSACEHRDRTGYGLHIDLSQYETICTTIGPALMDVLANKRELFPKGNDSHYVDAAPYGCYRCSGEERWCVIAVFSDDEWTALCKVMGNPAWAKKSKFATILKRKAHKKELDEYLHDWTVKQEPERIVEVLQQAGVPSGIVQNAEDLAKDPHLLERGFFTNLSHPIHGELRTDTYPIRFGDRSQHHWRSSPLLGEDNNYVFGELLGLSEKEIDTYIAEGIIT